MMVEKRFKMKKNAKPAPQDAPTARRTLDASSFAESWNFFIAQSMSEKPDEVFDIFEKYKEYRNSQMELASRTGRSLSNGGTFESGKGSDERDELEARESEDTRDLPEGSKGTNKHGHSKRADGYQKDDNYIMKLHEKLSLGDAVQNIQSFPSGISEGSQSMPNKSSRAKHAMELKAILDREIASSKELTRTLEELEQRHKEELETERKKTTDLESKMEAQVRSYQEKLVSEEERLKSLEAKIQKMEMDFAKERTRLESSQREESAKVRKMKAQLKEMEREHEVLLSDEQAKRSALESKITRSESSSQARYEGAQTKIKALEQSKAHTEELLESERAKVKCLEEAQLRTQAKLDAEKKKVKAFKLTEGKTYSCLEEFQKKTEVLLADKSKMEKVIERLSAKVKHLDDAQAEVASLTQELEEKDLMLLSIRQIVGAGLGQPTRDITATELVSYTEDITANSKREFVPADSTSESIRPRYGGYPSDSSSCTTTDANSFLIPWRE